MSAPADPVIYCFINGGAGTDLVRSIALAEDGTLLAHHISSSDEWARGDCGYLDTSMGRVKRGAFAKHYPEGYRLEWVDRPREHDRLAAATARNREEAS